MIFLLLSFLFLPSNAQNSCRSLNPISDLTAHNLIVFDSFTAKGSVEGTVVVQGHFNSSQIDIATLGLSDDEIFALFVGGTLSMQCGFAYGNLLHLGDINLGPGVDLGEYTQLPMDRNDVYDFSGSQTLFRETCEEMQQVRTAGEMEIIGDTLILTGHEESTELFNIPCEHLQDIRVIRFMDISSHDSTTIIMNLQGLQCSLTIQQADIHGVNFRSPGGHIVWTHCPRGDGEPTITLRGFMVGSLLAPYSTFDVDGYVEGQIIVNNLEGTIYSSRQLFRGCIPTERCALVRSHCTFQQRPQCPNPEEQVDPNDPCCSLWNCSDVCEPCPEVSDDCPSGQTLVVTTEAGAEGFDPCCDTWSCVAVEPEDPVDPFVAECPDDIVIQASLGASEVAVEWAAPRFLYTRTVTCSHHSPLLVSAGDSRYVSCIGQGFKEGTLAACMFEINIKSFNEPTSCSSGGVSYDDKTWFFDKCGQKCLCNAGTPTLCRRVRKPLLQMSDEELTQYWHVFKTVYNDPDGIIQGFVNNHVQMFSRGLHNNGAFLPWHRGYILATENRLREEDCTVTVPYWDQHTQPRLRHNKIWGEERRHCSGNGEAPSRNVYTGTFGSRNGFSLTNGRPLRRRLSGGAAATFSTIESNIYRRYLTAGQFDAMRNRLEHGPGLHDSVHCIVGGTMCSARSSNDPVFFSHHANTDRIWWHWQNLVDGGLTAYTGNTNLNDIMPVSPYTPKEVLNLMAQGPRGDIAVNYWTDEAYVALERLVSEMTPQELALIPTVSTEVTDDTFFWDMNMDPEQIEAIQQAEILQQQSDIEEAVALTLGNVIDRGFGSPNLDRAIRLVTRRLQADRLNGNGDQEVSAEELWLALARTMIHNDVVPKFSELQEILHRDDDGEIIDIEVVVVPIPCEAADNPVCADGTSFPNPCEAENGGYNSWTLGGCPTIDLDEALPEEADGGDSLEYNHEIQELAECPDSVPRRFSACSVEGTTCVYGLQCCNVFQTTMTCQSNQGNGFHWSGTTLPWRSCGEVTCPGDENVETRPPTQRPTREPTPRPTQRPTREPTPRPTQRPTRANTITRRPTQRPTPPPTRPRPRPTPPPTRARNTINRISRPQPRPSTVTRRRVSVPQVPPPPPADPCPEINFLQCETIRCCAPGTTLVERPVINGCTQNCPACMVNGRRTLAPTCCRGPELACDLPICQEGQTQILVQPQGENGRAPCCDRYRCGCPPDLVCSLDNVECANGQVARWTLDGAMDVGGCCRNAECLTPVCATDLHIVCDDGSRHEPVWANGCAVEPCPLVCPDEGMLTCPVSRSIAPSGQVPRVRGDPFLRDGTVVCLWQDCPPYEPCDDTQYSLEERHCHHNGECVRGLDAFRCQCDDTHEPPFCQTRRPHPPRVVVPLRDRSGAFIASKCIVILCQSESGALNDPECFGTRPLDAALSNKDGSSIQMFSITAMVRNVLDPSLNRVVRLNRLPVQFVGMKGDELWFLNAVGWPIKMSVASYDTLAEVHDVQQSGGDTDQIIRRLQGDGIPIVQSDESSDIEYTEIMLHTDPANGNIIPGSAGISFEITSVTDYSYRTATADPPKFSEWRFVHKSEEDSTCPVWTYFTDTAIGFYWKDYFHSVPWGPAVGNIDANIAVGDFHFTILSSTDSVEVCANECIVDDVLELCSQNGICNPDTGECMCDFGFTGDKCETGTQSIGPNECIVDDVLELCSNYGTCNPDTGECMCQDGWTGEKCELTDT